MREFLIILDIMLKSNILDVYSHMKIKINSDDELPLEKTLNIHNVIIIKSIYYKSLNNYYNQMFLEKMLIYVI